MNVKKFCLFNIISTTVWRFFCRFKNKKAPDVTGKVLMSFSDPALAKFIILPSVESWVKKKPDEMKIFPGEGKLLH